MGNRLVNDFIENLRFVNSVKANARVIILMKSTQSYLSAIISGPSLHAKGPSSRTLKVIGLWTWFHTPMRNCMCFNFYFEIRPLNTDCSVYFTWQPTHSLQFHLVISLLDKKFLEHFCVMLQFSSSTQVSCFDPRFFLAGDFILQATLG